MKKRCFILAAVALLVGSVCLFMSYPSKEDIDFWMKRNRASIEMHEESIERRREWERRVAADSDRWGWTHKPPIFSISYRDPFEQDSRFIKASNVSFGIGGILLVVGFIIGPEKKVVAKETEKVASSSKDDLAGKDR